MELIYLNPYSHISSPCYIVRRIWAPQATLQQDTLQHVQIRTYKYNSNSICIKDKTVVCHVFIQLEQQAIWLTHLNSGDCWTNYSVHKMEHVALVAKQGGNNHTQADRSWMMQRRNFNEGMQWLIGSICHSDILPISHCKQHTARRKNKGKYTVTVHRLEPFRLQQWLRRWRKLGQVISDSKHELKKGKTVWGPLVGRNRITGLEEWT